MKDIEGGCCMYVSSFTMYERKRILHVCMRRIVCMYEEDRLYV